MLLSNVCKLYQNSHILWKLLAVKDGSWKSYPWNGINLRKLQWSGWWWRESCLDKRKPFHKGSIFFCWWATSWSEKVSKYFRKTLPSIFTEKKYWQGVQFCIEMFKLCLKERMIRFCIFQHFFSWITKTLTIIKLALEWVYLIIY